MDQFFPKIGGNFLVFPSSRWIFSAVPHLATANEWFAHFSVVRSTIALFVMDFFVSAYRMAVHQCECHDRHEQEANFIVYRCRTRIHYCTVRCPFNRCPPVGGRQMQCICVYKNSVFTGHSWQAGLCYPQHKIYDITINVARTLSQTQLQQLDIFENGSFGVYFAFKDRFP